jgi:LTXXQ motif family protein
MNTKALVIGAIAAATVFAGGWALAQTVGSDGFGPPFMRGKGPEGMGHGMMKGMRHGMGPGMMERMHRDMGPGMMHSMGPRMKQGRADQGFWDPARLDVLRAELAITPVQEPAWAKYAKAVQAAASAVKAGRESVDPDVVSRMTPADRFAFVSKMRAQRQTQLEAVKAAAEELLVTLDETQKATAADILPGLAFGLGRTHGGLAGGHQHGHGRNR